MIVKSDNDGSPRSLNLQVSGEMDKDKPEPYLDSLSKVASTAFGQRTTSVAMIVVFEYCTGFGYTLGLWHYTTKVSK